MTLANDLNQPSTEAALSVLAASGWSLYGISREWEIPYHRLYDIALKHCIPFKSNRARRKIDVDRETVERMVEAGMSQMQIAEEMGLSLKTLRNRCLEWGIGFKRGRRTSNGGDDE